MNKRLQLGIVAAAAALCVALASSWTYAQDVDRTPRGGERGGDQGPGGDRGGFRDRGPGGPGGPGGNFDPAEFRQRMIDGLKSRLEVSDEEWSVIGPMVTKVFDAQNAARPYAAGGGRGGMMLFGGTGAPGAPGGDRGGFGGDRGGFGGRSDAPERDALAAAVASGTDVENKLKAYRDARDKKNAELKTAQEELRAVLTVKQEAFCVLMGLLD